MSEESTFAVDVKTGASGRLTRRLLLNSARFCKRNVYKLQKKQLS